MSFLDDIKNTFDVFLDRRELGRIWRIVRKINLLSEELHTWKDEDLRGLTDELKAALRGGKTLDDILIPAYACVREVCLRVLGQYPHDVQMLGGIVLHEGKIAEMKAGEGKTLTETLPVYLHALEGKGVHVVTTNDYLARRDAEWMGPIFEFLGLSVGKVTQEMENPERRENYRRDVTYVTNQEVGFDYLRDNLVMDPSERVLRDLSFAIVDEVDSILIDEARTPLIIADLVQEPAEKFRSFAELVRPLREDEDYEIDWKLKVVHLTEGGLRKVESALGHPVYHPDFAENAFFVDSALKAKALFEPDRDYIIGRDERGEEGVLIVDEFTGRVMPGRRFMDGIHQAIEAKEHVRVRERDRIVAAITFQNFFRLYGTLSGMSGTAASAREEFRKVYNLDVVAIPTHRPVIRRDFEDVFYKTESGKYRGIVKDVKLRHAKGQPLLIGTRSVEKSEMLSKLLRETGVPHQVLNAKHHAQEAVMVASGGRVGMVTVATNMAGRGTDILLEAASEHVGGLHVIGTERHEARRIDGQLRGRAGRQGDVGSSQFHISAEDELMQIFAAEHITASLEQLALPEDEGISSPTLSRAIAEAQKLVEARNFDTRLYLLQYDRIVNEQRRLVYALRDKILEAEDLAEEFLAWTREELRRIVQSYRTPESLASNGGGTRFHFPDIIQAVNRIFLLWDEEKVAMRRLRTEEELVEYLAKIARNVYEEKGNLPEKHDLVRSQKTFALKTLDTLWAEHLELLETLQDEGNLLSYGQRDPFVEYALEARKFFDLMVQNLQSRIVRTTYQILLWGKSAEHVSTPLVVVERAGA